MTMQNVNRSKSFNEFKNGIKREKKEHKNFRKMRRNPSKKQWQGI